MVFAKGRTNCTFQRDLIKEGFYDLLNALQELHDQMERHIKKDADNVISGNSLSEEEKVSLTRPFIEVLSNIEEKHIKIRNTILIGLYSFWESSLKDISNYYSLCITPTKKRALKSKHNSTYLSRYYANDYLKVIFHDVSPKEVNTISEKIKELRNYITHDSTNENRERIINELILSHPEYHLCHSSNGYYFDSYEGLVRILETMVQALHIAEESAAIQISHTK